MEKTAVRPVPKSIREHAEYLSREIDSMKKRLAHHSDTSSHDFFYRSGKRDGYKTCLEEILGKYPSLSHLKTFD